MYLSGADNPSSADLLHAEGMGMVEVAGGKQLGVQGSAVAAIGAATGGLVQIDGNASIACSISGVTTFFRGITPLGGGIAFRGSNSVSGNCSTGVAVAICAVGVVFADNSLNLNNFGLNGPGHLCPL